MNDRPLLHHDEIRAPGSTPSRRMLFLHGIYGAGRNWRSVARRFVEHRPEWSVSTVDLRSHGQSPRMSPPQTVEACSRDLLELERHLGFEADAVLGHSFGGKVALAYADARGPALAQAWIIDSTPAVRDPGGSAWQMLGVLRRHPGPFADRAAAIGAVESEGFSTPVAQWMATNVGRDQGEWRWRLDPGDMEALLRDFFRTDAWEVIERSLPGPSIHVVKASESRVLDDLSLERLHAAGRENGRVHVHVIEGGHWLNADNPTALEELLARSL